MKKRTKKRTKKFKFKSLRYSRPVYKIYFIHLGKLNCYKFKYYDLENWTEPHIAFRKGKFFSESNSFRIYVQAAVEGITVNGD